MTSKQKVVTIDRFLGLNLKADPMELRAGRRGYELAQATNVDVTDNFKIRRRKGYTQVRVANVRRIWGNRDVFLSVEDQSLYDVSDLANPVLIRSDLDAIKVPYFTEVLDGGDVHYSDGKVNGKFVNGQHTDWTVEEPYSKPSLGTTSGALYKGCYHVAVTFVHNDGRESGTDASEKVTITAETGGVAVSGIPQPLNANIDHINLYCSEANGTSLYKVKELSVGTSSFNITSRQFGRLLETQYLSPPPPSHLISYCNGRMYVAFENFLFESELYSYHLFNLAENVYTFPEEINGLVATHDGVYVSSGSTYYVNFAEARPARLQRKSSFGMIPGTEFHIDGQEVGEGERNEVLAGWIAENGVMVGGSNGGLTNLTEKKIDIGDSTLGAAFVRREEGITQIISSVRQPQSGNLRMGDVVTATVKRKGNLEDFNIIDGEGEALIDEFGNPVVSQA
jgi:hypothetical protein